MTNITAVPVPALEDHMVDCVVFPAVGSRPHPSQLSGGDLDGDIYFVMFDDTLLPPPAQRTQVQRTCMLYTVHLIARVYQYQHW
jgi:RNA dependent RNA polymerase